MPSFNGTYSPTQLQDIAAYVLQIVRDREGAGRGGAGPGRGGTPAGRGGGAQ